MISVIGSCLFAYGLKQGELCRRDNDCETGLMCSEVAGGETRSCQPPVNSNKQYSEFSHFDLQLQFTIYKFFDRSFHN